MRRFDLYVRDGVAWLWVARIDAADAPGALRQAIGQLKPAHYHLPIRVVPHAAGPPDPSIPPALLPPPPAPPASPAKVSASPLKTAARRRATLRRRRTPSE